MDNDESEMYRKLAIRVCRRMIKLLKEDYDNIVCFTSDDIKKCKNNRVFIDDDMHYILIKNLYLKELKEVLDWIFKKMRDNERQ